MKAFNVPTPNSPGALARFREINLVKLVKESVIQAKDTEGEVKIEPLQVVFCGPEQEGVFKVERNYLVNTPELTAIVTLTVYSFDSPGEPAPLVYQGSVPSGTKRSGEDCACDLHAPWGDHSEITRGSL